MADFNGILKEAIDGGESLESATRKAASLAAKEEAPNTISGSPRICAFPNKPIYEIKGHHALIT